MKTKKKYVAPELTTVSFVVERGFSQSSGNGPFQELFFYENDEPRQTESYTEAHSWSSGNTTFWN